MSDEFEGLIEDGSVAEDIVCILDETHIGKWDFFVNFEELTEKIRGKMPNIQDSEQVISDDDDGDWDNEDDVEEVPHFCRASDFQTGHQDTCD